MSNKMSKSLEKAQKKYSSKFTRKGVSFHKDNDAELLDAIEFDSNSKSFNNLVLSLLREHYNIKKEY